MKRAMRSKPPAPAKSAGLSRREFTTRATVAAAVIAAGPGAVLGAAAAHATALTPVSQVSSADKPKLSAESLAEADAKTAEILRRYGTKLEEAQKADVGRLAREAQARLESLRKFPLGNSNEPATVLQLTRAEERARRAPAPRAAAERPKRPGT